MPEKEMAENPTERASAAWTEVREDSVALLCWDNDRGETNAIELSPEAAGNLRQEFIHGPSVRHDR
jgi:hypothetical protein